MTPKYIYYWYLVESYDDTFIALMDWEKFKTWFNQESLKHYKADQHRKEMNKSSYQKILKMAIDNNHCPFQKGYFERYNHCITIYSDAQLKEKEDEIYDRAFNILNEIPKIEKEKEERTKNLINEFKERKEEK